MPAPNKDEKKEDYLTRCMGYDEMVSKHPDEKQRYAICNSMYDKAKAEEWVEDILGKKNENN